jgi:Ca2+-transporting ATPase
MPPLGDQVNMARMNTMVTRGRGELLVTATGMASEMGRLSEQLAVAEEPPSPLQVQLDRLGKRLGLLAVSLVAVLFALQLLSGEGLAQAVLDSIALAVAAMPEGLPAVVTVTLALGMHRLARRGAVTKRLASVETLGCTTVICSDKTGTLTMNKMTARELVIPGQHRFTVSGEGYSTEGEIRHVGGLNIDLDPYLLPMVLCADAVMGGDSLIGDPTEGALIVLGAKGGLDITETRGSYPRIAEVPFDSDYKFMATFHHMTGADGQPVVRCDAGSLSPTNQSVATSPKTASMIFSARVIGPIRLSSAAATPAASGVPFTSGRKSL